MTRRFARGWVAFTLLLAALSGCGDSPDGNTSLQAAVMEANSLAGDDTINLPAGTYTRTCMAIS